MAEKRRPFFDRLSWGIIKHRKAIVRIFLIMAVLCACCIPFVKTNYNLVDYLPESAQSTTAVRIMQEEFTQAIPNASVMVHDLDIATALLVKGQLAKIDGVDGVLWLDDVCDLRLPVEALDADTVDGYWHDGTALFQVTVADAHEAEAVTAIRDYIDGLGERNAVYGTATETAQTQMSAVEEVLNALLIVVPLILLLLFLSTTSWLEPLLFIAAIGVSIVFNMGTNIVLGEVSFITYSVAPILQLAVSLDYAIFLLHAFAAEREKTDDVEEAMAAAMKRSVSAIAASAVTTLFGFMALAFMQFEIGADLGLNLVKGIIFSFISVVVFLPALTLRLYRGIDKTHHRRLMPTFKNINKGLRFIRIPLLIIVLILVVPAFLGQRQTQFTYQNISPDQNVRTGADMFAVQDEFGKQNPMVVLVPRGDTASEVALARDIEALPHVTGVMSYGTTVGATIPQEILSDDVVGQFYSEDWARIILYADTETESQESWDLIESLNEIVGTYYDEFYTAGNSPNVYDMRSIVAVDNLVVSLVALIAIFFVLLITFRSAILPFLLLLAIESGIWISLSMPYFAGTSINFIGYLIINTVQLGATIDYAILLTTRYMLHRKTEPKKLAVHNALGDSFASLLVSACVLSVAGFALSYTSTLSAVCTLGSLLGRGAIISFCMVTIVLPALLSIFDGPIRVLTAKSGFYRADKAAVVAPAAATASADGASPADIAVVVADEQPHAAPSSSTDRHVDTEGNNQNECSEE